MAAFLFPPRALGLFLSLAGHVIALGILSAYVIFPRVETPPPSPDIQVFVAPAALVPQLDTLRIEPATPAIDAPEGTALEPAILDSPATLPDAPQISAPLASARSDRSVPPSTVPSLPGSGNVVHHPSSLPVGGGFEGRAADARAQLVSKRGGTPQSELAVERGLAWLVAHQSDDGGWRFNHRAGPCDGRCRNPGSHDSTTAATALALLPLLGAGNTHWEGQHQQAVARGLTYLQQRMIPTSRGGDLQEGTMYSQGLATITLCEALAMTGDEELREPAQQAIDFIVHAQHPSGGWRYFPGQPGDTTSLGWQWMALKSGRMAGLNVPDKTLVRASAFLDSVQTDDGAAYGYQRPDSGRTPTAVGLLCRLYSGWRRNDPRLIRGCERLTDWGPSYDDMYFNYYATQVLHHAESPRWAAWNDQLRNHLVATQATSGHEAGSWYFGDFHTAPGGRLCDTALAVMILEVYYRHLPLYGWKSVEF